MRIPCPHCGPRDIREFSYRGEVPTPRPDPQGSSPDDWCDYVYRRTNSPDVIREYWQHVMGCRQWLIVTRNVTTHEILGAEIVGPFQTEIAPKDETITREAAE
ncbi:MAG: sarcosine oxidase subunit delta [Pseudomonadota bacterium]